VPITATSGSASATVTPHRPSWSDMKKNYPDDGVEDSILYDQKLGGKFSQLYDAPGYENTCAVRMSYALNRSGLKLPKNPVKDASVDAKDGYWYWLRVADLKAELTRRFKGVDEQVGLTTIPRGLLSDDAAMVEVYQTRRKEGQAFMDKQLAGRNGIVVFDVGGFGDASGHFTLWDGAEKKLLYAGHYNNPEKSDYYFWLTKVNNKRTQLTQVVRISFWELK